MKKLDYLKLALAYNACYKRAWIISAFSVTKETTSSRNEPYIGQLIREPWGFSFYNEKLEIEKIDEADLNMHLPLFRFKDRLTIDSTWCSNVAEPIETSIGNILFNNLCLLPSFGNKIPFVLGRVSVSKLEEYIAPLLKSVPSEGEERDATALYVDEYIKFVDSLQFISSLSQLTAWSATPKALTPPTGIKEFKAELLKKYEGKLNDPVELSKFEGELVAFDDNYLKDDPGYGTFISGKVKNIARKKMFLTLGAEEGFKKSLDVDPVINSLEEGWPTDPQQFTALMNILRAGSFSRGAETVKGGVSAKMLLRAANNFRIQDTDCGTKLGIHRTFDSNTISQLVGRYIINKGQPILVENITEAANHLETPLIVRSPMYCILSGDTICKVCAGVKLSKYPTGLSIPLTEISSIILTTSLKAMHGKVLSTGKLDIHKAFT